MRNKIIICSALIFTCFLSQSCRQRGIGRLKDPGNSLCPFSVTLTPEEIKKAGIELTNFRKEPFDTSLLCYGYLDIPSDKKVYVTNPLGGIVKSIFVKSGSYVKAGSVIVLFENIDYVLLQQEYLETRNQYEFYREELKRQGELTIEDAASIKKMQQAEVDYRNAEIKLSALRIRLDYLGINPDSLKVEHISPVFKLKAPVSGYIMDITAEKGKFVTIHEKICEIVNNNVLSLNLKIPASEIQKITPGQSLKFWLPFNPTNRYSAKISSIAQTVDSASQEVSVFAQVKANTSRFLSGLKVKAKLNGLSDSLVFLPEDAILSIKGKQFIIIADNNVFTGKRIETGVKQNHFLEVKNVSRKLFQKSVVIKGFDYLMDKKIKKY